MIIAIIVVAIFIYLLYGFFVAGILKETPKDSAFFVVVMFWAIIIPIMLLFMAAMYMYDLGQSL